MLFARSPAPGAILGRKESEMSTIKIFRNYSSLVEYVESFSRRLSRFDVVNILVEHNGSVDDFDLFNIDTLYHDKLIDA